MKCDDCGNDDGIKGICPYASEITGEIIAVVLCEECHDERCQDI